MHRLELEEGQLKYAKSASMQGVLKESLKATITAEDLKSFKKHIALKERMRELLEDEYVKDLKDLNACLTAKRQDSDPVAIVPTTSSVSAGGILPAATAAVSSVISYATGGNVKKP